MRLLKKIIKKPQSVWGFFDLKNTPHSDLQSEHIYQGPNLLFRYRGFVIRALEKPANFHKEYRWKMDFRFQPPLQKKVHVGFVNDILYLYDANGNKLRKAIEVNHTIAHTTDYVGSFIYEDGVLQSILTAEGRVVVDGSNYEYQYFLKDHLGNTRVTFSEDGIIQEDSYYPFGMLERSGNPAIAGTMAGLSHQTGEDLPNKYLYNAEKPEISDFIVFRASSKNHKKQSFFIFRDGKELQDDYRLDWYDYGARFYDPVIGKWHVVDSLAEMFIYKTPYGYVRNNPISRIDPTGMADKNMWGRDRFNKHGVYIPPHEREDPNGNTNKPDTPSFNGNFLEDFAKAISQSPVAIVVSGNLAAQMYTGGIDVSGGILVVLRGEDKGAYPIIDGGIPISSTGFTASAAVRVMPVFFGGKPEDFKANNVEGTRLEVSTGIPGTLFVAGGFTSLATKPEESTFGFYVGVGKSSSIKGISLKQPFQINLGYTEVIAK